VSGEGGGAATRVIVVGVLHDGKGDYLLCRMPGDRGVFPGEWGLPGGGLEAGETLEQALRREIREELGLELRTVEPLFFSDATLTKTQPDGTHRDYYMIFLLFRCIPEPGPIRLNPEFEEAVWVPRHQLASYRLNRATLETFTRLGLLAA